MKKIHLDAYEQEIENALAKGQFKSVKNLKHEMERHRNIAKYTLSMLRKNKNINIRLSEETLNKLKFKAHREGLPYQTLIGSILHKYVSGTL